MKKEVICCIYKITSPTNKIYIGQTIDYWVRVSKYRTGHCKYQIKLYNSIKKHGWENHKIEIVQICTEAELNDFEILYMDFYDCLDINGLNLSQGGSGGKKSEITKRRMSENGKRKNMSEEGKAFLSIKDENGEFVNTKKDWDKYRTKRWIKENRERYLLMMDEWKKNNKHKLKEYSKKHSDANKEKTKISNKNWREKHPYKYIKKISLIQIGKLLEKIIKIITIYSETKFCKCGCGELIEIKAHHINNGIPDYSNGHNPRSEEFKKWMGKRKIS